jgi:hypothetical protein
MKWLQQPVERVYVLLDAKGKTMSHAYVEVGDTVVAGRILRGEGGGLEGSANEGHGKDVGKPRERGSVLGKGRRARGVTITRSGQEELMADVSTILLLVLFLLWDSVFALPAFDPDYVPHHTFPFLFTPCLFGSVSGSWFTSLTSAFCSSAFFCGQRHRYHLAPAYALYWPYCAMRVYVPAVPICCLAVICLESAVDPYLVLSVLLFILPSLGLFRVELPDHA